MTSATTHETVAGTTGVLGGSFRADVTTAGTVVPWDGSSPLAWHVAADDRWHSPAAEATVRQQRVSGAPVFETRVRVPGGDAVQRVWSVADAGGLTLVEVANDSPLPIACAFTRQDLLTARPPADVPIEGIELPPSIVLPIGHRASVTVALAHQRPAAGALPAAAPADATARGWVARAEAASRVVLPAEGVADDLVAARAEVLLTGAPDPADDPCGLILAVHELVRLGDLDAAGLDDAVVEVAAAVHAISRRSGWDVDAGLAAAAAVLTRAGEERGARDVARIRDGRAGTVPPAADGEPSESSSERSMQLGVRAVAAIERRLVADGVLLPAGIPTAWLGQGFEGHGLPVGPASTVSFAVRWHGEHAAVLWEVAGDPVVLTAPAVDASWRAADATGEALWRLGR